MLNKEQNTTYTKCNGLINLCCTKKENMVRQVSPGRIAVDQCRECGNKHYYMVADSGRYFSSKG